jgi:hypothetical protein
MSEITDEQISSWRNQQKLSAPYGLYKATVKRDDILGFTASPQASLNAELELTTARHQAECDRLENLAGYHISFHLLPENEGFNLT